MSTNGERLQRVALYHPWPPIDDRSIGGWVKTMLLFFDGVAVLAPPDTLDRLADGEPEIIEPLIRSGDFRVLDPFRLIDGTAVRAVSDFLETVVDSNEGLKSFGQLSYSALVREGGIILPGRGQYFSPRNFSPQIPSETRLLMWSYWSHLRRLGIVTERFDDGSIRAEQTFWGVYESLLSHLVKPLARLDGLDIQPATDDARLVRTFSRILDLPGLPSSGHVIAFDLEKVLIDLTHVPIEGVLEFREAHGKQFRSYARSLQMFAAEVSAASPSDRSDLYNTRQDEVADAADELKRLARRQWRQPVASIAIGVAGAGFSIAKGSWPEAIIALLGGIVGTSVGRECSGAFSYLFRAQSRLSR